MTRPRILLLTTQLGYGGAETSFIRLANLLATSMGVTIALFTASYGRGDYASGHEPLHAAVTLLDNAKGNKLVRWLHRIRRVRDLKATHDVCISFLSGPNLVNVLAGHNTRSVVSLRGSRFFDPVSPRLQRLVFQYLVDPLVYRLAARMVPVSPGLIHEIRWVAGARAAQKARVIPPFIEVAQLPQRLSTPTPAPYDTLAGQRVIVAVGRLSVEKGFQHLIRVFVEVANELPGTKLLLIGDGPMREALRAQCEEMNLAIDDFTPTHSAVIFAGYQRDVLPLMKACTVFALPSATEGFPNAMLEAMAAGLPVLAADTPWGARAILSPDRRDDAPYPTTRTTRTAYGTLMPRMDDPAFDSEWTTALIEALCNPQKSARARIADFDVVPIGKQWRQVIHDLLGR